MRVEPFLWESIVEEEVSERMQLNIVLSLHLKLFLDPAHFNKQKGLDYWTLDYQTALSLMCAFTM